MKAVWDSCMVAGITPPDEVREFFNYDPPDSTDLVVDIPCSIYLSEMHEGVEVKVKDIPEDVTVIRFWMMY